MTRSLFKFIVVFLLFQKGLSQTIQWTEKTSQYNLPAGIRFYEGTMSNDPVFKAWYAIADLSNQNLAIRPYASTTRKDLVQFSSEVGAYVTINGGYFDMTTGAIYSSVVYPNEVKYQNVKTLTRNSQSYPVIRSFFGMNKDFTCSAEWIYHFSSEMSGIYKFNNPLAYSYNDPNPKPAPQPSDGVQYTNLLTGIGGGPMLVKNGVQRLTYNEEIFWGSGVELNDSRPRTAVGVTADNKVIFFVTNGLKLSDMPKVMQSLGCVNAINLDGGGSSAMAIKNQTIYNQGRTVPAIFCITHRDSLNLPKTPTYENIIDTEMPQVEKQGGWFETANAGYYGNSKSLLNAVGDGSNYVKYNLNLPGEAEYFVYAWWVASSNRSTATPYIVKHKNGETTVKMDQTKGHASWNLVGKFTFSGSSDEYVKITNAGYPSGAYVVADAIKIVSYDQNLVSTEKEQKYYGKILELYQNYPNPFNPTTTISYNLPSDSYVELTIYDIYGRKIKTLVEENQKAGRYSFKFNANDLASGIYVYILKTDIKVEARKMNLMK
jgi:hypothetical protein